MGIYREKQYIGVNNPFFGKHHTKEVKQIIKNAQLLRYTGDKK